MTSAADRAVGLIEAGCMERAVSRRPAVEPHARSPGRDRDPGDRGGRGCLRRRQLSQRTTITLYSGQHAQTTQSLVAAFEKQDRHQRRVRSDDEDVLADQIAAEGSHSPADVFLTENSPPLEFLQAKGLLAAVEPATLASTPGQVQLAARRLGRASRPGSASWSTTRPSSREPAAHVGDAARGAAVPGQARPSAGGDRLPADRDRGAAQPRSRSADADAG